MSKAYEMYSKLLNCFILSEMNNGHIVQSNTLLECVQNWNNLEPTLRICQEKQRF